MTEQEFLSGLTTQQATFFNDRIVSIRSEFQATYASNVAEVVAAKDALFTAKEAELTKTNADVAKLVAAHKSALDAKEAELTTKQAELTTANATIATRDATIATLSSETATQATRITELQASNAEKQSTIDAANATIATLQAKVAALDAIKAFNPRHLASTDVFLARFTQKETKEFYASSDPVLVGGQAKFELYEREGYYIDLDDPDVQGLTAYMVQLGKIESMERRAVILRDATAAEAHYATI